MKCFFVFFILLGTVKLTAQDNNLVFRKMIKEKGLTETWKYAIANEKEFDIKLLRGLCMYVGSKEKVEGRDGKYVWGYQMKILHAAKVDTLKDNEAVIAQKISRMWNKYDDLLVCAGTQFDITYGSIIKYAVNMKFEEFLIDMVSWKVNLNKVDEVDNMTPLDYIQKQMERSKGISSWPYLKSYYDMFRKAGAKHKAEL
jgi:hypothetical protein